MLYSTFFFNKIQFILYYLFCKITKNIRKLNYWFPFFFFFFINLKLSNLFVILVYHWITDIKSKSNYFQYYNQFHYNIYDLTSGLVCRYWFGSTCRCGCRCGFVWWLSTYVNRIIKHDSSRSFKCMFLIYLFIAIGVYSPKSKIQTEQEVIYYTLSDPWDKQTRPSNALLEIS